MVQREVADRFFAVPSTKAYGAVSVLVQLVAERTGFHPVSRVVFRPRPNVDSALVAFRRTALPPRLRAREACRRRRVRAPPQDARRTRSSSRASPTRQRAEAALERIGRAAQRSRRGARAAGVPRARRGARGEAGRRRREDQPRARRRAAARRRQARARDRLPARRALATGSRSSILRSCASRASPATRSCGARSSSWPTATGRASRRGSRSASPSQPGSAAAAPTRRRPSGSRTSCAHEPHSGEQIEAFARDLGADVPYFLADGPQLGTGDGTELSPLELPQDYWVVLVLPRSAEKTSTGAVYSRLRHARRRGRLRRTPRSPPATRLDAGQASTRPRRAAAERPRILTAHREAAGSRCVPCRRHGRGSGASTGSSCTATVPAPRSGKCPPRGAAG